jgi:hypothetical protein
MDHLLIPPDADLHSLLRRVWDHMDVNILIEFNIGDLDDMVEE